MLDTIQPAAADVISVEDSEIGAAGDKKTDSEEKTPGVASKPPEVSEEELSDDELSESSVWSDDSSSRDASDATEVEEEERSSQQDDDDAEEDGYDSSASEGLEIASSSANPGDDCSVLVIGNKTYPASSFVRNRGYIQAQGRLRGSPKATFTLCDVARSHNILSCRSLHLTNRALLVGDRYVRLHMLLNNAGKRALLENPSRALGMKFCHEVHEGAGASCDMEACEKLHLAPGIVFIGVPGLRTAYYENELHQNLAFNKLKQRPWETQCGTWCRKGRSHVITTCLFLHYQRGSAYTERPNPPSRPLALIPKLTPRHPAKATIAAKALEYSVSPVMAGKKGASRGQARGRRGRGRGRGRGAGHAIPLPEFVSSRHPRNKDDASAPAVVAPGADNLHQATRVDLVNRLNEKQAQLDENDEIQKERNQLSTLFFALLIMLLLLLFYAIKKPFV